MAKYFDPKKWAKSYEESYFRLGLYVSSPQWGHENFCDIHLMWGTPKNHVPHLDSLDGKTLHRVAKSMNAMFTGPNSSLHQTRNVKRSRPEMQGSFQPVQLNLDISAGGDALALEVGNFPQTRPLSGSGYQFTNRFQFWLFGPLMLQDRPYGSLFFELAGPFRRDMIFRPFHLRASRFDKGLDNFIPSYADAAAEVNLTPEEKEKRLRQGLRTGDSTEDIIVHAYNQHVSNTIPASLPPNAHRWEWRVEAYDRFIRRDQALKRSG